VIPRTVLGVWTGGARLIETADQRRERTRTMVARLLPQGAPVPPPRSRPPLQCDPTDPECSCERCDQ
jgi:hypothetical protein